jgi:DNA-binding GntR family transcriptional regulator
MQGATPMDPVPPRAQLLEQVYDRLLQAICSRRLAPGSRIAQEQLAASLGVSRQPVSHALQLLKQQGLVRGAGRRGLVVAPIEADYVHALYEVRAALDAIAAARAARQVGAGRRAARPVGEAARGGGGHAERLAAARAILERGRAAVAAGDKAAMVDADLAFHGTVNELAANPVIAEIARGQWSHIRRAIDVVLDDPALHARIWEEHAAILAAIEAGDAARAERLARDHARRAGDETWQRLIAESDRLGRAEAAA